MLGVNGRLVVVFCAGVLSGTTFLTRADTRAPIREPECGTASGAQLRTTLYFGLGRPKGTVSELEWQLFVIGRYRKAFEQESVLWETARVCAAL
jgi:hypothetical protein